MIIFKGISIKNICYVRTRRTMSGGFRTTEEREKTNLRLKYNSLKCDEATHKAYAFDEQHVPKKVHRFYFVKFLPYEDPKLRARIEDAENQITRLGQEKSRISQNITGKMVRKFGTNEVFFFF